MADPKSQHIACTAHNHKTCIDSALAQAKQICETNKIRLTPIREKVLRLIWQSHRPLGAYDILGMLSEGDKVVAPPTVYRALDFLVNNGLVHRIESMNAFVGCSLSTSEHVCQFLLCRECGIAIEMESPAIANAIQHNAKQYGFSIDNETIEITGLCNNCRD